MVLVGGLAPVLVSRFFSHQDLSDLVLPVCIALIGGGVVGWLAAEDIGFSLVALIVGVIVGVSADAAYDSITGQPSRNLLAFEWLLWTVVLVVPAAAAAWLMRLLLTHTKVRDGAV